MNLRTFIKCVILIQIRFRQLIWVVGGEKKRLEKTHFDIFRSTNCDFSTSSPISQKMEYLDFYSSDCKTEDSSGKLGIKRLHGQNPFSYFYFFTSGNPCDSSPPSRRNHEPKTPEKFVKHGFSFFNPNIPLSLETRPTC